MMFSSDLSRRLPATLNAIEIGEMPDDDDLGSLAELAAVAVVQAQAAGSFGGSGPLSVRSMNDQPAMDPENDLLMVSHVREIMKQGAAVSMRGRSGRAVAAGDIPYEDRGKTVRDASALSTASVLQSTGGEASGGPDQLTAAQWIPVGLWALQAIGKILAKRRENRGK